MTKIVASVSAALKSVVARRRGEDFACGDCLRNAQCGAPPDVRCVTRAAQIASGRRRAPSRDMLAGF